MNAQSQPLEQRTRLATSTPAKSDFEKLLGKEHKSVSYVPFGETESVELTVPLVQQLLCEKTKSGKTCSDNDAKKFIVMCRVMRLNPFEKDAFITGYDTKQHDGSYAAKFSIIIAHQAYLKRAEASPDYDVMDSGIILRTDDGGLVERETDFVMPEETKLVVGGWAKVYRRSKSKPTYRRCTVANKRPEYESRFWSEDKTPEMICKCAEADALRSAFPTLLGGLTGGDIDVTDRFVQQSNGTRISSSLVESVSAIPKREEKTAESEPVVLSAEGTDLGPQSTQSPAAPTANESGPETAVEELQAFVLSLGCTFDQLKQLCIREGWITDMDSLAGFDQIAEKDAKRLMRAKIGLKNNLVTMKEGQ